MPIMQGIDACKEILDAYERYYDEIQEMVDFNDEDLNESTLLLKIESMNRYRPVMVLCSSLINNQIQKQAMKVGFDLVFENPLNKEKLAQIQTLIFTEKQKMYEAVQLNDS